MFAYFDLMRTKRIARTEAGSSLGPMIRQLVIYASVVVGIMVLPLIRDAALGVSDAFTIRNLIVALVVGLALFPAAYRNAFDQNSPLLSQAGIAVMCGFGWENVVHTAIKATTP